MFSTSSYPVDGVRQLPDTVNKVSIEFESCGCWSMMQKHTCFTPDMGVSLGECFKNTFESVSKEFGFNGVVEMTEQTAVIHISK